MFRRALLLVLALLAGLLTWVPTLPATGSDDPGASAERRLRADAQGPVTVEVDRSGAIRFVGTSRGGGIDNPSVGRGTSVRVAARAHLDRYGAALGAATGTRFVEKSVTKAPSGVDVVRLRQTVSGVPVLGGDVVLGLGADHELRSLAAAVAAEAEVVDASQPVAQLERTALGVVGRDHPRAILRVEDLGRWVLDPTVVGLDLPGGVRTVRQLEVRDGGAVRELVLVDDHTGGMVFRTSLIEPIDRVVCDRKDVRGEVVPCTSGFARTETSGSSGVEDVDAAFDLAGATADFYQQVAGVDLTGEVGIDVGGVPRLAATVNFCTTDARDACPYANAFWDGTQMFYGRGFAAADDVVAHEMTHGFIDQHAALFYWGQSGAINESLADVIGEVVDHRHPSAGDSASDWSLGEDLPVGAIRNLADPTAHSHPDTMTSALYTSDPGYYDNGGVHTNSGVGNRTAYLISQGGSVEGQAIAGIDAGDPTLAKTGRLYVEVIQRLLSGSDYADLARALGQACSDLAAAGTAGFVPADCVTVQQAVLATKLTTTPPKAAQPADAPASCPDGTTRRVLLDGEANPESVMTHGTGWVRSSLAGDRNATSGTSSWFARNVGTARSSSLSPSSWVTIPEGQPTYLWFQRWHLLDYEGSVAYDGGLVRIETPLQTAGQAPVGTWINGPNATIASGWGNSWAGKAAFARDSRGWVASRQELSDYAGQQVRPHFILSTDSEIGFIGWYLDDITIFTCDPPAAPPPPPPPPPVVPTAVTSLTAAGVLDGFTVRWQPPARNAAAVTGYVLSGWGGSVVVPATARSHTRRIARSTTGITVKVAPRDATGTAPAASVILRRPALRMDGTRSGDRVRFRGSLRSAGRGLPGRTLRLQRWTSNGWAGVASATTRADGTYVVTVSRRARASYRMLFRGGTRLIGTVSPTRYR